VDLFNYGGASGGALDEGRVIASLRSSSVGTGNLCQLISGKAIWWWH